MRSAMTVLFNALGLAPVLLPAELIAPGRSGRRVSAPSESRTRTHPPAVAVADPDQPHTAAH